MAWDDIERGFRETDGGEKTSAPNCATGAIARKREPAHDFPHLSADFRCVCVETASELTWFAPERCSPAAIAQARRHFRREGRVHIPDIFKEATAQALLTGLEGCDWRLVLNGERGTYDFSAANVAAMDPAQQKVMLGVVHSKAGAGFQFMFDSHRISDEYDSGRLITGVLADLYAVLNSAPMLDYFRAVTGEPTIAYLDAQATRYRPGHFLNEHDDDIEGKDRLFAYVFNLTPVWRADWGGLLLFLNKGESIAEAYTPAWNALNILRVPQAHAVSMVAPFARGFRYSITGWMRSKRS